MKNIPNKLTEHLKPIKIELESITIKESRSPMGFTRWVTTAHERSSNYWTTGREVPRGQDTRIRGHAQRKTTEMVTHFSLNKVLVPNNKCLFFFLTTACLYCTLF